MTDGGWELITRRLCLIKDTGHAGVLWGGTMMGWIDEAGATYAGLKTKNAAMVTKAFTEIAFQHPVRPGDFVEFWGRVNKWGQTSVAIDIRATARRPTSADAWEVVTLTAVFVAVDEDLQKTAILR
ncbi:MAG: acyl-CoA thioesterase [Thermoplasmatota archaeon]